MSPIVQPKRASKSTPTHGRQPDLSGIHAAVATMSRVTGLCGKFDCIAYQVGQHLAQVWGIGPVAAPHRPHPYGLPRQALGLRALGKERTRLQHQLGRVRSRRRQLCFARLRHCIGACEPYCPPSLTKSPNLCQFGLEKTATEVAAMPLDGFDRQALRRRHTAKPSSARAASASEPASGTPPGAVSDLIVSTEKSL